MKLLVNNTPEESTILYPDIGHLVSEDDNFCFEAKKFTFMTPDPKISVWSWLMAGSVVMMDSNPQI